jgi:hypothetical protein
MAKAPEPFQPKPLPPPPAPTPVVAVAKPPAPPPPAPAPARPVPPEPRRVLREVAFRPLPGSSAVVVRLSASPRFEVAEIGDRRVSIQLSNTIIERRNDARPLDTSFFPGAVASVVSTRSGSATRIDITLKRKTVHRERVEGDTLVIEFDHPGEP